MKKNKPTFEQFVKNVYNMSMLEYRDLRHEQRTAIEIDYTRRYGKPIIWF